MSSDLRTDLRLLEERETAAYDAFVSGASSARSRIVKVAEANWVEVSEHRLLTEYLMHRLADAYERAVQNAGEFDEEVLDASIGYYFEDLVSDVSRQYLLMSLPPDTLPVVHIRRRYRLDGRRPDLSFWVANQAVGAWEVKSSFPSSGLRTLSTYQQKLKIRKVTYRMICGRLNGGMGRIPEWVSSLGEWSRTGNTMRLLGVRDSIESDLEDLRQQIMRRLESN